MGGGARAAVGLGVVGSVARQGNTVCWQGARPHSPVIYPASPCVPQDDRHLVLVQEYAPNGNLYRLAVEMGRCMTEQHARLLVLQPLLLACTHMHAQGIIHRCARTHHIQSRAPVTESAPVHELECEDPSEPLKTERSQSQMIHSSATAHQRLASTLIAAFHPDAPGRPHPAHCPTA